MSLSVFLVLLVLWAEGIRDSGDIGYLSLNPGNGSIHFGKYDTTIQGDDIDGAFYFFLPSYINLSSLDYSNSKLSLISDNGLLLERPDIDTVESVFVGGNGRELIKYNVGFLRGNRDC